MKRRPERSNAVTFVALGFFVAGLMVFLSLSFRTDNVIAASFRLDAVQICEELDDGLRPVNPRPNLPGGAKQACLWFEYSRAREGDSLEILWSYDGKAIQADSYRLQEPEGTRAFYLLRDDGTSLPGGAYSVAISCNRRERWLERFSVETVSGDLSGDMDEALD
jgi:hypothetical protein